MKTIPNRMYVLTTSKAATLTCQINGKTYTLVTATAAGQYSFVALAQEVTCDDTNAFISGPFDGAPTYCVGGGSGGGGGAAVDEEQLLHASIGLDSLAAGPGAVAYCADSLAIGLGAVVGATYDSKSKTATATRQSIEPDSETNNTSSRYKSNSVSVGLHAQASGYKSTAYGNFATTLGVNSTAVGHSAQAHDSATAVGMLSLSSGTYSAAVGMSSESSGYWATAVGSNAKSKSYGTIAIGFNAIADAKGSMAVGMSSLSSGANSAAIGSSAKSGSALSNAIGYGATIGSDGKSSVAIGAGAYVNDAEVVALNAGGPSSNGGAGYSTQLYVINKGSTLSTTYLGGEAGLGYIVVDHVAGSIVARGVIPLASICTEHTDDFEPTGYANIQDY